MSVPPVNYSMPPPRLDMPPPGPLAQLQSTVPSPQLPVTINPQMPPVTLHPQMQPSTIHPQIQPAIPTPKIYSHPPPYNPVAPTPFAPMSAFPSMNLPPPPVVPYMPPPVDIHSVPPPYPLPIVTRSYSEKNYNDRPKSPTSRTAWSSHSSTKSSSKSLSTSDFITASKDSGSKQSSHYPKDSGTISKYDSATHIRKYDKDSREREIRHREKISSHSPGRSSHYSRNPSSREIERHYRDKYEERREYERRRYEYERSHNRSYDSHERRIHCSPSRRSHRSPTHRIHSPARSLKSHSSRRDKSPGYHSLQSPSNRIHRSSSLRSHRSPINQSYRSASSKTHHSPSSKPHCSPSRRNHSPSKRIHHSPSRESSARPEPENKCRSDREKILEEHRKNYCKTSEEFFDRMVQWSKEHNSDEEEVPKMWYRSSPAELYYKLVEGGTGMQQTAKLESLCDTFFKKLIERGRNARPAEDELPPLKMPKPKICCHKDDDNSSSSSSEDDCLDEDGLQGYSDRIMLELQRKQSHPRRLHPEMWFNNTGEMNGGPLCRCSARAKRHGMRHGVYAGEEAFPKCLPLQNNTDKLYHYRITVSPPTNFLIKAPTIISHDEHEFLFSGFSMFSHYKLAKLPNCKVIRFNIEYTILYVEEPAPSNFTIKELDLFEEFLFIELLELIDLDLGKGTDTTCSQFHFMPRFVRYLPEGGCEVLSMCEILKYLLKESGLLIPPQTLDDVHSMDHYTWQKFVDRIKGMIVTYPGKKPCSVRVDQLDRNPPSSDDKHTKRTFYPEIVHFGVRPPQLSYAGNPEYQKAWRYYVKYRHLIANMGKPSFNERQKLAAKEAKLQEMRTQSKMKRDVTVAISSKGFHTTGLMCDVVQHAMLIPVLVRHLRFHKSLDSLEVKLNYVFKQRALLQTALTHPSYRENFGTNPDHARNSLTNCGIRQPEYGNRKIHYTRKKGIVTLINIMSRFGKHSETESKIKHNERLEFLGDAVVEFLSSIHLFRMFPGLAEGALATYRASIVQNQHLAQLAKNIELEQFMLYAHGSDLCREVVMRHAMANCFEALMGALFLDAGIEVTDRIFALALWHNEPDLLEVWNKERIHPLQEQEPLGDRKYIKNFEFLQKLTKFEDSIGVQFKHIRLLARAFTDRSVGFTHLTLGSNQRLEFLGDTVLQLVVSDRLYRHFPDHHEGHLSLLRSSLVNNRTQAMVCDDLNMSEYAIYNNPKTKPTAKKHKADLLEAFLGALFIDKNLEYCQVFCNACLFPRLQEFIMNQDWNDPKSKLQQCCLTLRSMEGGEPDIPVYKVIECLGPTNTRVYTVGVYFRGKRLAAARGHSIQEAEMNAAENALNSDLFPQLDHQKRVIAKSIKKKRKRNAGGVTPTTGIPTCSRKISDEKVPKAYKTNKHSDTESSGDSIVLSDEDMNSPSDKSDEDSGLDSDIASSKLDNVQVSSLINDMQKIKDDFIKRNEYEKLKEKCRNKSDSDEDL